MEKYRYIFHTHTEYSPDCDVKLHKLYKKLKKKDICGIAITDHNTIKGAIKFDQQYGDKIQVIIGEEIMTTHGEIIGLFLTKEIEKGLSPIETINKIKEQNGLVYIPHPYDKKRHKTCLDESYIFNYNHYIDIIESFNGRCIYDDDIKKMENLSSKLKKASIVGCDAHTYYEYMFNHVILFQKVNRENIVDEIKKSYGSNKKNNKVIHHYTKFIRMKKLLKEGKFNEAFNLIYKKCSRRLHKISREN